MYKLKINKQPSGRELLTFAAAGLALFFVVSGGTSTRAELTPELQTEVSQILAAGGPDLVATLATLAQNNPDMAVDILSAGCAGGADCGGLLTAISQFTDSETDAALQTIAQSFGVNGTNSGGSGGGGGGSNVGGGSTTSENPNQTSGSETG